MKHLEELEKELEDLLAEAIPDNSRPVIDLSVRKTPPKIKYLKVLLLERQILEAYDAIEERKEYLTKQCVIQISFPDLQGFLLACKDTLAKFTDNEIEECDLKNKFKNQWLISDYEWNWLKR